MKKFVLTYNDNLKTMIYQVFSRIPFLKDLEPEAFLDVFYNMKHQIIEAGSYLLKKGDSTEDLFVVTKGHLAVETSLDGNEFVIENLYPGSVLNHRVIFTDDYMIVNVRAACYTNVLSLSESDLDKIEARHPKLHKKLGFYKNALFRDNKIFPLDYVLPTSSKL